MVNLELYKIFIIVAKEENKIICKYIAPIVR